MKILSEINEDIYNVSNKRFVILEMCRTPHLIYEDSTIKHVWFHKNGKIKQLKESLNDFFTISYYDENEMFHREEDLPSFISYSLNGLSIKYYKHGKKHRGQFKPAVIGWDGTVEYWVHGDLRMKSGSLKENNFFKIS